MPKRERLPTDPVRLAAAHAFARGIERMGYRKHEVAEKLEVSEGMVSHWATGRSPIPGLRAAEIASVVGVEPEDISPEYIQMKRQFARSQPPRLDPQMMAEALVAVLKAQEADKRAFKPGHVARALCAIYEYRATKPAVLTKRELALFDELVLANLNGAWEELGEQGAGEGAISYRSTGNQEPPKARRRAAAG